MTVPHDPRIDALHLKEQAQGQKLADSVSASPPSVEEIVTDTCYGVMDDLRDLARELRTEEPRDAGQLAAYANQLRRLMSSLGKEAEALDAEADVRTTFVRTNTGE